MNVVNFKTLLLGAMALGGYALALDNPRTPPLTELIYVNDVDGVPTPTSSFSQAVVAPNGLVYVACHVAAVPDTHGGEKVLANATRATSKIMSYLQAILAAAGSSFAYVLSTTIALTNPSNFAAVNTEYKKFFTTGKYPAREVIQVAALPKGATIAISMVATQIYRDDR